MSVRCYANVNLYCCYDYFSRPPSWHLYRPEPESSVLLHGHSFNSQCPVSHPSVAYPSVSTGLRNLCSCHLAPTSTDLAFYWFWAKAGNSLARAPPAQTRLFHCIQSGEGSTPYQEAGNYKLMGEITGTRPVGSLS